MIEKPSAPGSGCQPMAHQGLAKATTLASGIVHGPIELAWETVAEFTRLDRWVLPNADGVRVGSRLLVSHPFSGSLLHCVTRAAFCPPSCGSINVHYVSHGVYQPGGAPDYALGCHRVISMGDADFVERLTALDYHDHVLYAPACQCMMTAACAVKCPRAVSVYTSAKAWKCQTYMVHSKCQHKIYCWRAYIVGEPRKYVPKRLACARKAAAYNFLAGDTRSFRLTSPQTLSQGP